MTRQTVVRHIGAFNLPRDYGQQHAIPRHDSPNYGLAELSITRSAAEIGSAQLRDATQALFRKWERRHGFVEGAAQLLLLAGWRE